MTIPALDDGARTIMRQFYEVVLYAHKIARAPVKPEVAAMKVTDMYLQFLQGCLQTNAIKEMGPGVRLDFSKFAGATP